MSLKQRVRFGCNAAWIYFFILMAYLKITDQKVGPFSLWSFVALLSTHWVMNWLDGRLPSQKYPARFVTMQILIGVLITGICIGTVMAFYS